MQGFWNELGQLVISTHDWGTPGLVHLKTLGNHNALNALAACGVCIAAGISKETIIQGLESFEAVSGRMKKLEVLVGQNPITIIDDTYNANPDSVIAAIDAINGLRGQHWLVLGDMGEVGDQGPTFHEESRSLRSKAGD
jgi:UDP-N-acetylmuramoyl-tripeptide--D-alanyl-D-alanine ligase